MKYTTTTLAVVAALAMAVGGEDRHFGDASSGLTNLINPGSQGPYPSAAPPAPYPSAAPPAPYPAPAPAPQSYSTWDTDNQGFTVQSGYEGFLLPQGVPEGHSALLPLGGIALGASLLKHLLPFPLNKIAFFFTTKIGLWVAGFFLLTLVGGAATTALCAFTPLCTISFLGLGRVNKETTRALLSQDNLNSLTQFVHDAIDTYKRLQTRVSKSAKNKKYKEAKERKDVDVQETSTEAKEEAKEEAKVETPRAARAMDKVEETREFKESKNIEDKVENSGL